MWRGAGFWLLSLLSEPFSLGAEVEHGHSMPEIAGNGAHIALNLWMKGGGGRISGLESCHGGPGGGRSGGLAAGTEACLRAGPHVPTAAGPATAPRQALHAFGA